jgi:hypothetical protein
MTIVKNGNHEKQLAQPYGWEDEETLVEQRKRLMHPFKLWSLIVKLTFGVAASMFIFWYLGQWSMVETVVQTVCVPLAPFVIMFFVSYITQSRGGAVKLKDGELSTEMPQTSEPRDREELENLEEQFASGKQTHESSRQQTEPELPLCFPLQLRPNRRSQIVGYLEESADHRVLGKVYEHGHLWYLVETPFGRGYVDSRYVPPSA